MDKERWVVVWRDFYSVSDLGRVRSDRRGRMLKPDVVGGYAQVTMMFNGLPLRRKVHHLVAEAFLGGRPEGKQVNHLDCNKLNNRADNLEYTTRKENAAHAVAAGRYRRGSQHYKSHTTEAVVREIRRRYRRGDGAALGREFGLDRATVNHIIHRHTWTHL